MNSSRDWYEDGVAEHYAANGSAYRNPHEPIVAACVDLSFKRWPIDTTHVLDLSAGSGELTRALLAYRPEAKITAADPFTFAAYEREVGRPCERWSFETIANGKLRGRTFSLVGCSFAMHLCPPSLLPQLALELAQVARQLLILTPHKRPIIRESWGWSPIGELIEERVRARLYASNIGVDPAILAAE
jgi:hypothetical protein